VTPATDRLALVPVEPDAAAAVLAGDASGGGRLSPGPGWPHAGTLGALSHGIADRFAVLDGLVVGECGVVRVEAGGTAELGWSLAPNVRGRGLGSAMVRLLVRDALARPGVSAVSAEVLLGNEPSWRAAVAAGFRVTESGVTAGQPRNLSLRYDPRWAYSRPR